jgi:hypothetical protein
MPHSARVKSRPLRTGTLSALATQTFFAAAGILVSNYPAIAGNCDNVTNTILPGQLNQACGSGNTVGGTFGGTTPTNNNTGLGSLNQARGGNSTSVGYNNLATTINSTAIGESNAAYGRDSTSVGSNNFIGAPGVDSNGRSSSTFGSLNLIRTGTASGAGYSTALGSNNDVLGSRSTAVGYFNRIGKSSDADKGIYFNGSTAIGYQSFVYGSSSVVMGDSSEAGGRDGQPGSPVIFADRAVAIGHSARARFNGTIAIGDQALAGLSDLAGNGGISYPSADSIAIGTNARVYGSASTTGNASIAIGARTRATGDNSVVLGSGSVDGGQSNVVSVGNALSQRRIVNVAAGVGSTDAVNISQLANLGTSTVAALGTGSYSQQTSSIEGISYVVGGSTYGSVADAIGALQGFTPNTGYFSATGTGVASAGAPNATAMGANSLAQGQFSVAAGNGAFATSSKATAIGSGTTASGIGATAVGFNSTASGLNSSSFGLGARSAGANSVAIGASSTDGGQSNVVSVGSNLSQRRIINVANGIDPNDAANIAQLDAVNSSLLGRVNMLGASVGNQIAALENRFTGRMNEISDNAYAGTAMVAAISGIPSLAGDKLFNLGIGFGNYLGESGVAVGGHVRLGSAAVLKAAVGYADSAATTSVGLGFSF